MRFRCLLFDLDGTLVDTRADLTTAVNLMLGDLGLERLTCEFVVSLVGEGAARLVGRALTASLGREPTDEELRQGLDLFRRHYRDHLLDATRPYDGVPFTLEHFSHLPRAVVTNKPLEFTEGVLAGLGLRHHFAAVLGGDSLPVRKPSAAPLLEAARLCGVGPEGCLMVGDSVVDIHAGKAAGIMTCGFVGGFRGRGELEAAGADYLIEHFGELRRVVEGFSGPIYLPLSCG
jgi:phosphoglycolate phosphatase